MKHVTARFRCHARDLAYTANLYLGSSEHFPHNLSYVLVSHFVAKGIALAISWRIQFIGKLVSATPLHRYTV
jgi:hypothetical protein